MLAALKEIGLSKNESLVYLNLLELGQVRVTDLSKKAKLYRSNVYESLNSLEEKGLVNSYEENKIKHYMAEDPSRISILMQKKHDLVNQILPMLELKQKIASQEKNISIYHISELKNLLFAIRSKTVIFNPMESKKIVLSQFYQYLKENSFAINIINHNEHIESMIICAVNKLLIVNKDKIVSIDDPSIINLFHTILVTKI